MRPAGEATAWRQSVVLPSYQRRDLVCAAVRALAEQTVLPLEVVVVVDGSTDGTAAALRALELPFPLHVVEQANAGAARARNRGATQAQGELLLFLDDDMMAAPDLLQVVRDAHVAGAEAVVGHIPLVPGTDLFDLGEGRGDWPARRRDRLLATGIRTMSDVLTGQLSVRRDVFEALGGFDERFTAGGSFGAEDQDFGRRLLEGGYRVDFAPDAVSFQHYAVTPRAHLRQWHQAGAADVTYLRKHPGDFDEVYGRMDPEGRANRLVIRPLARVPVVRDAVAAAVRPAVVRLAERRRSDPRAARVFYKLRSLEYWRGVEGEGGLPEPRAVRVLCYHALVDLRGGPLAEYGVPADALARQLRLLRRCGVRFVGLDEALRAAGGERGVPRRAVLVTFDDCYADLLALGLPVLQAAGVPAVAYAVADRVGATNTWDARLGAPTLPLLDAAGLRALEEGGVEVGVHGATHVPLTSVSADPAALAHETRGATDLLRGLGLTGRTFAYPHGAHDAAAREAVADAGLRAAFTVGPGVVRPGADLLQLPRVEVLRSDGAGLRFLLKVWSGGRLTRPDLTTARRRARRRLGRVRSRLRPAP